MRVNSVHAISALLLSAFLTPEIPSTFANDGFCNQTLEISSLLRRLFISPEKQTTPEGLLARIDQIYLKTEMTDQLLTKQNELTLGSRFKKNDPHAVQMAELGAKISTKNAVTSLKYPDLNTFIKKYTAKVENLIATGKLDSADALYPAITFKNKKTNELRFYRLGTESGPNSTDWALIGRGEAISHREWGQALAEGKLPFDPRLYDHDFSHSTEYLEYPEKMAEMKHYYERLVKNEVITDDRSFMTRGEFPESSPKKLYYRVNAIDEGYSLPDLRQADRVRERMPFLFDDQSSVTVSQQREILIALAKKDPTALLRRAQSMLKESNESLLRIGGVVRDSDHLDQYAINRLDYRWNKLATRDFKGVRSVAPSVSFKDLFFEIGHTSLKSLEKILAIQASPSKMKQISKLLKLTAPETAARLTEYLAYELAPLEASYRNALLFKITPEKLAREGLGQEMNSRSDTYRYFNAVTEPGSILHWAFVSGVR